MQVVQQANETLAVAEIIGQAISRQSPRHPFLDQVNADNLERVLAEYLAMSISFPFIQAGAVHANYRASLQATGDTSRNVEVTSAIGAFLTWDEFGGYALTLKHGIEGLLSLNATQRNFHSNHLRGDIRAILGKDVAPSFSPATVAYLDALLAGLSDSVGNRNVAHMVAFEFHANEMIGALWQAIGRITGIENDERLKYFYIHVGGDSPAEAVHVEMTQKMIAELIAPGDLAAFVAECVAAYELNAGWCAAISDPVALLSVAA